MLIVRELIAWKERKKNCRRRPPHTANRSTYFCVQVTSKGFRNVFVVETNSTNFCDGVNKRIFPV